MKRSFLHRRLAKSLGFTLIELLVVMGIIAILAAVLFPSVNSALLAAKRAKAANLGNQIQTAVLNYYGEYSVYPAPAGQAAGADFIISDASASATAWSQLLYGLCGNAYPYNGSTTAVGNVAPNSRSITFLNLKGSDVDANNAPKNPATPSTTTYPYFNIAINYSYSGAMGSGTGAATLGSTSPTSATGNFLPNLVTSATGSISLTGVTNAGVAVWANCNPSPTTSTWNPKFFVSTF